MRSKYQSATLAFAVLFFGTLFARSFSTASELTEKSTTLIAAIDDLDQWVGAGKNGDKWRLFLKSKELRAELPKGSDADPAVIARILQQYEGDANGLEMSRFVTVKRKVRSLLETLQNKHTNELAKLAWAVRGDHQPVTIERLASIRANLRNAAQRLENRLGMGSTLAQGWKQYLDWPSLEPHLSDDAKITGQSLRALDIVLRRFRSNHPGLENPVFGETADALESYRELALWHALGKRRDTRPRYAKFLLELEKQITRNQENPSVESTRQVGKTLGMIQQLGHSPRLVAQLNAKFKQPNIWASFSSQALQQLAQRPVSDTTPVRDCILGARVLGTANSTGRLSLRTLTAGNHIALELRLAGNIQTQTFNYKKPVRVGSQGSTDFTATKQLQLSDQRFYVLPATTSAHTSSQIQSIKKTGGKFGHRLIERIARKKVAEQKPQAEYIAARHAEQKVSTKFDKQVVTAIYEARKNYDTKLHPPLERLGMFPEDLHMSSTTNAIQIKTTLASYKQISTDRLPPGKRTDNDMTLQLHESAVNNFLPHLLGGAKIQQDKESEPPRITGEVPAWLKKAAASPKVKKEFATKAEGNSTAGPTLADAQSPNAQATVAQTTDTPAADELSDSNIDKQKKAPFKAWSFLLNNDHPVSVSFHDQKITLRIRIAELMTVEDGEESIRKNWDLLITYRVVQDGNQIVLKRDGSIEALPTGFDPQWFGDKRWDDKLTAKQVGVRRNLEENINKRAAEGGGFPLEIPLPPVELPQANGLKKVLMLQELHCDDGWLTLGYRLP